MLVGPSSLLAWTLSSATYSWIGNGELAIEHAARALRLSPFDPFVFFTEHIRSQVHCVNGDYDRGCTRAQRNARLTSNLRTLAAALVARGDVNEARSVATALLSYEPAFRFRRSSCALRCATRCA